MTLIPEYDAFAAGYDAGQNQIVYTRLAADLDTPVSLMLKLAGSAENAFMLESVTGGEVRGRYSIIGMKPDLIWRCNGNSSEINRDARFDDTAFQPLDGNPLDRLRDLIAESRIDLPEELPQAAAGLFGYLGYDMVRLVEHLPNVPPDVLGVPDAVMLRPSVIAVLDGVKGEVTVVSPAWAASGQSARAAYAQAAERVMDAVRDLERAVPAARRNLGDAQEPGAPVSNFTRDGYKQAVETAREYIRAGDIFQVVPGQRWTQDFREPPFALYRSLRRTNPSPFMFYFNFGGFHVVGASPEILVRVFGNEVTIRPIAGTRPRGATPEEDRALEADLLADEKELAEHLMLLDLGRNDVGRVAKIGTVRPTEEFIVERYSHVMHIVSNVVGKLQDDKDALDAFFAGMPAGTVSGAPKVRAMEIIDELEPEKRGISLRDDSLPLSDYLLTALKTQFNTASREGRSRLVDHAMGLLAVMPETLLKAQIINELALIAGVQPEMVRRSGATKTTPDRNTTNDAGYETVYDAGYDAQYGQYDNDESAEPIRPRSRPSDQEVGRTPVRYAITLLLNYPQLVEFADNPEQLVKSDLPGMNLLVAMVETAEENPNIHSAGMLEHFRGTQYEKVLLKLARWQPQDADMQMLQREVQDCFRQIRRKAQTIETEALLHRLQSKPFEELSAQEKHDLRALLEQQR